MFYTIITILIAFITNCNGQSSLSNNSSLINSSLINSSLINNTNIEDKNKSDSESESEYEESHHTELIGTIIILCICLLPFFMIISTIIYESCIKSCIKSIQNMCIYLINNNNNNNNNNTDSHENTYNSDSDDEDYNYNPVKIKIINVNDFIINMDDYNELKTENCSICIELIENDNNEIIKLNCNHVFHKDCLSPWLVNENTCPLCRQTVI